MIIGTGTETLSKNKAEEPAVTARAPKALYKPRSRYLGQYRAVGLDANDWMISGRRGWIFLANRAGTRLGVVQVVRGGSEKLTYCDYRQLKWAISRIEVLRDMGGACRYANNPNARHDDDTNRGQK